MQLLQEGLNVPLLNSDSQIVVLRDAEPAEPVMRLPPLPVLAALSPFLCGCWLTFLWLARWAWLWIFQP